MSKINHESNPLGKSTEYIDQYDASLLYPISRNESWEASGLNRNDITFYGEDIWNAYEVSWLNSKGKPIVCLAEFRVPASSTNIVESKSFKLYLNSYNQTVFESRESARQQMVLDLSQAAGKSVKVIFHDIEASFPTAPVSECIDELDIEVSDYDLNPDVLVADGDVKQDVWICSHLLKSNCPVTGQPDWGSLYINYSGSEINAEGLLKYIVSLRQHQDFHEQCVERTFRDILQRCHPTKLTVIARYVRRGGLDINPIRSTEKEYYAGNFRLSRQ